MTAHVRFGSKADIAPGNLNATGMFALPPKADIDRLLLHNALGD
jgi:hypothetical protein